MRTINDKYYYTPDEICKLLDMKRAAFNYARRRGCLPFSYIKVMSRSLYDKEEVDNYIQELEQKRIEIND